MSDYPPGVSGNEPEIAGYPERDESRHVVHDGNVACSFSGDVVGTTVFYDGETVFYYECPKCGTDGEVCDV